MDYNTQSASLLNELVSKTEDTKKESGLNVKIDLIDLPLISRY